MDWHRRPTDALPSWAADELAQRLLDIDVAVELSDGSTRVGRLDDVARDRSAVELVVTGRVHRIPADEIVAYAVVAEAIDHSDELRGA